MGMTTKGDVPTRTRQATKAGALGEKDEILAHHHGP